MRLRRFILPALALGGFGLVGRFLSQQNPERFDPVVECSEGHRYRSIWVPGGSLKALRWFNRRYQWCPVGRHWSWTRRADPDRLTADEIEAARAVHDLRVA
jgi:hypothetical protein